MRKIGLFVVITLISFGFYACQQENTTTKEAVNPMTSSEYNYLIKDYAENDEAAMGKNLAKTEVYKKVENSSFRGEDANYTVSAFDINRKGEAAPIGVLIKLEIDRLYSTLGENTRKQKTKYLCIPSAKSSSALHDKYNEEVQKLGFKDYEIYLSHLSKLLSELYL